MGGHRPVGLTYFRADYSRGLPKVPEKSHEGDAGWDLFSSEAVTLREGASTNVPTGISAALPYQTWGLIVPRSSTLRKWNLEIIPGVIDNGYRGELFIQARAYQSVAIPPGTRLAQLILMPLIQTEWVEVENLPDSSRGTGGFGSSGV